MDIEDVKLIHELKLSELIRETYRRPYQLQQQGDMMGQNEMLRVTVPQEPDDLDLPSLEEWSARDVNDQPEGQDDWEQYPWVRDLWWEREFYPDYQEVLNDLHARGLLPAGDYVIHVWW